MEKLKAETIVPQGSAVTLQMYPKAETDTIIAELEAKNRELLAEKEERERQDRFFLDHGIKPFQPYEDDPSFMAYGKIEVDNIIKAITAENARLKKELEGPGVYRIKNPSTPEESEALRLALEKSNQVLGICRKFHDGCRVARSVLFYALGIAATYQAKYFRLEFQSDRGALVLRKQRQAARLLDKARSGFYMEEEETVTTAQDALNGRR